MTEEELARHDSKTLLQLLLSADARCDALTAERDAAYAQGYSDAETEISKSALGQRNYFLHSQYENATDHIKVLTTERDRLREALTPNEATKEAYMGEFYFSQTMIGDDGNDVTVKTSVPWTTVKEIMAAILARAALKGETP